MSNETDNAFRVLQGDVPVQSLRCKIGWHRWSLWEYRGEIEFMNPMARCHCVDCRMPRIERPHSKSYKA